MNGRLFTSDRFFGLIFASVEIADKAPMDAYSAERLFQRKKMSIKLISLVLNACVVLHLKTDSIVNISFLILHC